MTSQAIFTYYWAMSPARSILDQVDLALPKLPEALAGLKIAHITDLHAHGPRRRHGKIADLLRQVRPDMIVCTGDYVTRWHHSNNAPQVLAEIRAAVDPPLGVFGVHGNHDLPELRDQLQSLDITWLDNQVHRFQQLPLEIGGADTDYYNGPDSVALAEQLGCDQQVSPRRRSVRLVLCHLPTFLPAAADLGTDIMFAGHTHGGQIRLPGGLALRNSTDMPLGLTAGVLRHRNTVCCTSRGVGEVLLPIRVFCSAQLPVYTLCQGAMPGEYTDHIENVIPW